jgi:hypothetical protein
MIDEKQGKCDDCGDMVWLLTCYGGKYYCKMCAVAAHHRQYGTVSEAEKPPVRNTANHLLRIDNMEFKPLESVLDTPGRYLLMKISKEECWKWMYGHMQTLEISPNTKSHGWCFNSGASMEIKHLLNKEYYVVGPIEAFQSAPEKIS